jgi:3-mercaptopyruvate sulfurtransferase SseA
MMHICGHQNVKVLNGDWTKWTAEERPTESGEQKVNPIDSEPGFVLDQDRLISFEAVQ